MADAMPEPSDRVVTITRGLLIGRVRGERIRWAQVDADDADPPRPPRPPGDEERRRVLGELGG